MHEIDMTGGRANVAFVGEVPWHGLGTRMRLGMSPEAWKRAAGLDWEAKVAPVLFMSEGQGSSVCLGRAHLALDVGKEPETYPKRSVLYRSDTKVPLGLVSHAYIPVQPGAIIDFFGELCEKIGGFTLETAGSLQGGRKVWALAKSEDAIVLPGNDRVCRYLLLATSYDLSLATVAAPTSIRVVCMNTLYTALHAKIKRVLRVVHRTNDVSSRIRADLNIDPEWETFKTTVTELTQTGIGDAQARRFFYESLYPESVRQSRFYSEKGARKVADRVWAVYKDAPGQTLESSIGTLWGAVSGLTYWVDHGAGARTRDNRLNRAWFGPGAEAKARGLVLARDIAAGTLTI